MTLKVDTYSELVNQLQIRNTDSAIRHAQKEIASPENGVLVPIDYFFLSYASLIKLDFITTLRYGSEALDKYDNEFVPPVNAYSIFLVLTLNSGAEIGGIEAAVEDFDARVGKYEKRGIEWGSNGTFLESLKISLEASFNTSSPHELINPQLRFNREMIDRVFRSRFSNYYYLI
ncbi:hypothetical protein BVX95_00090 [archaeon D22]|nr:hypothetical protein BVX95_00090 [archaeon D22]